MQPEIVNSLSNFENVIMFFNVANILMYSKLIIVDSMGDILKEVFIVSDGKFVERANNWNKHYYLN